MSVQRYSTQPRLTFATQPTSTGAAGASDQGRESAGATVTLATRPLGCFAHSPAKVAGGSGGDRGDGD